MLKKNASSAGLEFSAIAESGCPRGTTAQVLNELGELSGLAALRYTINWLQDSTVILLQHAPKAIETAGIDALIVNQASPAGGTVVDYSDIPFVKVCKGVSQRSLS